jgi:hypothetical protein
MDSINNKSVATELDAWVGILYSCMSVDMQVTNYEITVMSRILVSKQIYGVDIATLCKMPHQQNRNWDNLIILGNVVVNC